MANTSKDMKYAVKITANRKIYDDLRRGKGFTIKYPHDCQRCKRHRSNLFYRRRNFAMEPLIIPKRKKDDRKKSITSDPPQSPVNWQFSPLINYQPNFDCHIERSRRASSSKDSENTYLTDCTESLPGDRRVSVASRNFKVEVDPYIMRHPSLVSHKPVHLSHSNSLQSGIEPVFVRHPSLSSQKSSIKYSSSLQSSSSGNNKDNEHKSIASSDDTSTVQSFGVRCRYCLSPDSPEGDKLISPCLCSGTSQYVHKTCLEKWLTLRNLNECEVCRTKYTTQWEDRPMCMLNFPTMERRDVMLLLLTISFYVTLIFQLLGIIYISSTTQSLHTDIKVITLIGLSLGLFWFMIGSIVLTIVLYTSEYWRKWRYANKRKVVILDNDVSSASEPYTQQFTESKPMNISGPRDVRANISSEFDLSLAVPV